MPCNFRSFASPSILALLAALVVAGSARAQDDPWARLVLEADSIGPETPRFAPSRWTPCPATPAADSVRVAGPSDEFLFSARSLRTRGMFTSVEVPDAGGSFALRAILCDEAGRPLTLVVERDHRFFYLVFSLRAVPSYRALTLFSGSRGTCFRWSEEHRSFASVACRGSGGTKC